MNKTLVGEKDRLRYLDGLRGLGASAVVLNHFFNVYGRFCSDWIQKVLSMPPVTLLTNGRYAVFIFFVLSGFVISQSAAGGKSTLPARIFVRYLRLTIPMFISLLYARCLFSFFPERTRLLAAEPSNAWLAADFSHPLPNYFGTLQYGINKVYTTGICGLDNVVWTMRKELVGSILIYIVYRYCPLKIRLTVVVMFCFTALLSTNYFGFPAGALRAEFWRRNWIGKTKFLWIGVLLLSIALACDWPFLKYPIIPMEPFISDGFWYVIAASFLIWSIISSRLLSAILTSPVPQFLGRISFPLYLIHFPLLVTVIAWFYLRSPSAAMLSALFVAFIAVVILLAWMFAAFIDEPLMKKLHGLRSLEIIFLCFRRRSSGHAISKT